MVLIHNTTNEITSNNLQTYYIGLQLKAIKGEMMLGARNCQMSNLKVFNLHNLRTSLRHERAYLHTSNVHTHTMHHQWHKTILDLSQQLSP
jgi:hypothetical protein